MGEVLAILAWAAVAAVAVPAAMLCLEIALAFARPRRHDDRAPLPDLVIVIPAHDEGASIIPTLDDLGDALWEGARILVVADNCTDDTAAVARGRHVDVIERNDPDRRGKGYALQFAIDNLRQAPPDCIAFFDADCRVSPGALREICQVAMAAARPAQAKYEMAAPEGSAARTGVAQFAWIMINHVRMAGLSRLGNVTRFTGVGLAAPWPVLSGFDFGGGQLTEDHALTLALAERRKAPVFCPSATVKSAFPDYEQSALTQRARWEHGSLSVLKRLAPRAVMRGLATGNRQLVLIGLDALIPPMVLFAGLLAGTLALAGLAAVFGASGPLIGALVVAGAFGVAMVAGWARFGRTVLPVSQFGDLITHGLQKFRVYGGEGRKSASTWTRTERARREEK